MRDFEGEMCDAVCRGSCDFDEFERFVLVHVDDIFRCEWTAVVVDFFTPLFPPLYFEVV